MTPSLASIAVSLLALALLFGALERLWPAAPATRRWLPSGRTDVAYWFFTPLVTKAISRVGIVLALVAMALALGVPIDRPHLEALLEPRPLIARQPVWLQIGEFLFLTDLAGYAIHRAFHRGVLWPFHAVHHSSRSVDWLSSVRVHPLNDAIMKIGQAVPVLLLGFDPKLLAGYVPFLLFYAIFIHANVPWSFGPLRYVVATPFFHRWHHAAEDQGLQRNFAGLFPVIDLAFGTLHVPRDRQPQRFGVPGEELPEGFAAQLAYPFRRGSRRVRPAAPAAV